MESLASLHLESNTEATRALFTFVSGFFSLVSGTLSSQRLKIWVFFFPVKFRSHISLSKVMEALGFRLDPPYTFFFKWPPML